MSTWKELCARSEERIDWVTLSTSEFDKFKVVVEIVAEALPDLDRNYVHTSKIAAALRDLGVIE